MKTKSCWIYAPNILIIKISLSNLKGTRKEEVVAAQKRKEKWRMMNQTMILGIP